MLAVSGITIIDRKWVRDPSEDDEQKEVITYAVASSSTIQDILTSFPRTQNGSFAVCIPEGVCRVLIDGVWV